MTRNQPDIIQRYVYAVTRQLPPSQRDDIAQELTGLIEEMVQNRSEADDPELSVLQELGNPSRLAATYRGYDHYVIGPRWYDLYLLVLRVVVFAVTLAMVIASAVGYLVNPSITPLTGLTDMLSMIVGALIQAIAWVTVVFFIIERVHLRKGVSEDSDELTLDDLPEIPHESSIIPRSEPIVSMVVLVVFGAVLYVTPSIINSIQLESTVAIVNPFQMEVFRQVFPWMLVVLLIGMCIELAKLLIGVQSRRLAFICLPLYLLSTIISVILVAGTDLWNPQFIGDLAHAMRTDVSTTMQRLWDSVPTILTVIIVLSFFAEVFTTVKRMRNSW